MATSFMKMSVLRRLETVHHNQLSATAAVSILVMVLLTTQPSSAKRTPLGDVNSPEHALLDFPILDHQTMVNSDLHKYSTQSHDAERLLTLLLSGQLVLPNKRLLYHVREGDREPHLYVRAPSPSGKEEIFQFSLKQYKVTTKPYHNLVILDSHDRMDDQPRNRFWDSNKVVADSNLADDENDGNGDLDYEDREMIESTFVAERKRSEAKRSLRLPRSPVTDRSFLGVFSDLYPLGVDEGQGARPFHVPTGYDGSEASVNLRMTNNHQQWNTRTTAFPGVLYPLQQSKSLQTRNGRGRTLSQGAVGDRESFQSGGYAHATWGSEYDTKNTLHENLRNYISQKKTLQNKKRDLSLQHVTLGENTDAGRSQTARLYRSSALEESNIYNRHSLENAVMRLIIRGEERWDKRDRSDFGQQFGSLPRDELISLTSQRNVPVAVSERVLTVSPVVSKTSEYDEMIGSVPPYEDVYGSLDERALVLETGDQHKFWFEEDSGLLQDSVFSRPALSPTVEPHLGLRIFKRSAGSEGLRKSGVPHLVKQLQEGSDTHISGMLSKRSPLSHGYVAGIGADMDHHQNHDHIAAAATGSALHQAHHHDTLPPAVILSSVHHHSGDAAHHLVAKSETTVGGSAGGAGSGRGPNQEDSGPGALVVLHPAHPLVAAHADDDTIHVIAAVPFAVAHHHELHHEADHVLSKSTTLTLAEHDSDPHLLAKTTTVTTVTQHDSAPLLVVHSPDAPVVLLHHPPASQSSTSTTTVHKPPVSHNLLRVPLGGFGVGVAFGGAGAGHGFYAAG